MDAGELIPLARAAALAYARLFPGETVKDAKTLDLLAVALSALVPLYQQDVENGPLRRVADADLARGRFTRGAARLEFAAGPPLRFLLVPRGALHRAIETIAHDPSCQAVRRTGAARIRPPAAAR
jgi:hypothetical protein